MNVVLEAAVPRSWVPPNPVPGGSWEQGFLHACHVKSGAEDFAESDESFVMCLIIH